MYASKGSVLTSTRARSEQGVSLTFQHCSITFFPPPFQTSVPRGLPSCSVPRNVARSVSWCMRRTGTPGRLHDPYPGGASGTRPAIKRPFSDVPLKLPATYLNFLSADGVPRMRHHPAAVGGGCPTWGWASPCRPSQICDKPRVLCPVANQTGPATSPYPATVKNLGSVLTFQHLKIRGQFQQNVGMLELPPNFVCKIKGRALARLS